MNHTYHIFLGMILARRTCVCMCYDQIRICTSSFHDFYENSPYLRHKRAISLKRSRWCVCVCDFLVATRRKTDAARGVPFSSTIFLGPMTPRSFITSVCIMLVCAHVLVLHESAHGALESSCTSTVSHHCLLCRTPRHGPFWGRERQN